MKNTENFTNNDGTFIWFTGVVEDIQDPREMGRVRVRCYGHHTDDKNELPTADLPWASQMLPINSASMSGMGYSGTGLLQGSWVIGFFRDGTNGQDPIIMGSVPSMSAFTADTSKGFNDPDGVYPRTNFVIGGEPDTPRPARSEYSSSQPYTAKEDNRQEEIETAVPPRVTSISPDKADSYYERQTWQNHELEDIIDPVYPKNHVHESESGHVFEIDDTAGNERISNFHRSGTYDEVVANGDKTVTVVGNEFEVTFKDKNMYIKGNVNVTIDGNMKTLVKGNYHLEVEGNKTEYIKGDSVEKIGLNKLIEIDEEYSANISKNYTTKISGNEIRDVSLDSTLNIMGNFAEIIGLDYSHVVYVNETNNVNGNTKNFTSGTFTSGSGNTFKEYTYADMDVDATANIVMNGANILLN
jgi:hypothetical protein